MLLQWWKCVHFRAYTQSDPCSHARTPTLPQEKEFEITNEYIFALGSHVIYWSSKDVSLFVAQQVVADAIAHPENEAAAAPGTPAAAAVGAGVEGVPTEGGARRPGAGEK